MRFFLVVLCVLLPWLVIAQIHHVPDDFETIQAGIDAAEDGDTVLVAPGEYWENIVFNGQPIIVGSLILATNDPAYIDSTIINGGGNASVVIFRSGNGGETILRGFTLTNGHAANRWSNGSGIHIQEDSHAIIEDMYITGNTAGSRGGGVYCYYTNSRFSRCRIEDNNASVGGGISICGGAPIFETCSVRNNVANCGGGIDITSSSVRLRFVDVSDNNANSSYGAIDFWGCDLAPAIFDHVTIAGNSSAQGQYGALMLVSVGAGLKITNSIIRDNVGQQIVMYEDEEEESLEECLLTISFSDIAGGEEGVSVFGDLAELTWGEGNIDADPLFADPDNGDYHLTEDSPCIDAGDPDADPDPDGSRADMGAYSYHQCDINVEVRELIFEPLQTGETDSLSIIISNTGGNDLTVDGLIWTPDLPQFFTHEADEFSIEPQGEYELWVYFLPDESVEFQSSLLIQSNDPDEGEIEVEVRGNGFNGVEDAALVAVEFCINGVYPNPFNSSVTISYSLSVTSEISLQVFDLTERWITCLTQEQQQPGLHSLIWNASDLPSGMYFLRLESGRQQFTRKVMLIR